MTIDENKLQKIVVKYLPSAFVGWGNKGFMCQVHYPELLKIVNDYIEQILHEALKKQREVFMLEHDKWFNNLKDNRDFAEIIENLPEPELGE